MTIRRAMFALFALALLAAGPAVALAQDALLQAKQAGLVGEQPDGLVGAVPASPAAEIKALVAEVNAKRLDAYAKIAAQNGATVEQTKAVSGVKLIELTPSGFYIKNAAGEWVKKP